MTNLITETTHSSTNRVLNDIKRVMPRDVPRLAEPSNSKKTASTDFALNQELQCWSESSLASLLVPWRVPVTVPLVRRTLVVTWIMTEWESCRTGSLANLKEKALDARGGRRAEELVRVRERRLPGRSRANVCWRRTDGGDRLRPFSRCWRRVGRVLNLYSGTRRSG